MHHQTTVRPQDKLQRSLLLYQSPGYQGFGAIRCYPNVLAILEFKGETGSSFVNRLGSGACSLTDTHPGYSETRQPSVYCEYE